MAQKGCQPVINRATHTAPAFYPRSATVEVDTGMEPSEIEQKLREGKAAPEPLAYRLDDAVRVLGVSRSSLYELAKAGKLKMIRIAGRALVDAESMRILVSSAPAQAA